MCRIEGYSIGEWLAQITGAYATDDECDDERKILKRLFRDNLSDVHACIACSPKDFWALIADDPPNWLQEMFDEVAADRDEDPNCDAKHFYDTQRGV